LQDSNQVGSHASGEPVIADPGANCCSFERRLEAWKSGANDFEQLEPPESFKSFNGTQNMAKVFE